MPNILAECRLCRLAGRAEVQGHAALAVSLRHLPTTRRERRTHDFDVIVSSCPHIDGETSRAMLDIMSCKD